MTKKQLENLILEHKELIENRNFEKLFSMLRPEEVKFIKRLFKVSNVQIPKDKKLSEEAELFLKTFPEYRYRIKEFEEEFDIKDKISDSNSPLLINFCDDISMNLTCYDTDYGEFSNVYGLPSTIYDAYYSINFGEAYLRLKLYFPAIEASSRYSDAYDEVILWIKIPNTPGKEFEINEWEEEFMFEENDNYDESQ